MAFAHLAVVRVGKNVNFFKKICEMKESVNSLWEIVKPRNKII